MKHKRLSHLDCSGEELKHGVESVDEGIETLEDERLLELPGSGRLALVGEVRRQSHLVLLKEEVLVDENLDSRLFPTRKQVLNSFKLRIDTFTFSSPSST